VRQVLVYPNAFMVDRVHTDDAGVVRSGRDVLSGESWAQGQVILSWKDVLEGAAHPEDGFNVVVHEFAHQLDFETGYANGAPDLGVGPDRYARWSGVMQQAYETLCMEADGAVTGGPEPFLDPYGATNPAEFFAVASESFFGQARALADVHPALYGELKGFYRLDPASW
jgi:Mlc titration factor MtfA (ptsG expression regulator)